MADLAWPTTLQPNSFSLKLYSSTVHAKSLFGRTGQTVNLLNDRWTASVSVDKRGSGGSELEVFCNSLRNGSTVVEFGHFFRPTPLGTLQGSTTTVGISARGSSTVTLVATTGLTLRAGDYFSTGGMLMQVAADCTAVSSQIIVPVTLRLRKPVPASSLVLLSNPVGRFRLVPGTIPEASYGVYSVQQGVDLSFVEAVV